QIDAGFADLAGGEIDGSALDAEVSAEEVEVAADDLETAGEVRPGGVAGDRDLAAPFAVQAVRAWRLVKFRVGRQYLVHGIRSPDDARFELTLPAMGARTGDTDEFRKDCPQCR